MARVLLKIPTHGARTTQDSHSWRAYYSRFPLMARVLFEIPTHGACTTQDSHSWRAYCSRFPLMRAYYSRFPLMARVLFEIPSLTRVLSWYGNYHDARTIRDSLSYLCSLGRELSWCAYYSRFPLMAHVLFEIPTHGARTIRDSLSYLCSFGIGIIIAHVYIVDSLSYLCSLSTGIIMTRVLFKIPPLTCALLVRELSWRARLYCRFPLLFMLSWYGNYHGVRVYIVDSLSYLCSLGTGIIMACTFIL